MKKRIIALMLVLTMMLSMVSCGKSEKANTPESKKETSIADIFQKIDGMEAKTVDFTMDMDLSGIKDNTTGVKKVGVKLSGITDGSETGTSSVELAYRLDDESDYTLLTSFIYNNKTLYIDYASLKKAAKEFITSQNLTQYTPVIECLPDASFVKIDEATAKQLLSTYVPQEQVTEAENMNSNVLEKVVRTCTQYVVETIQGATKDVNPALITVEENGVKLTIKKENASATSEAISALDLNAKYDELVQLVKAIEGADQYATELNKNKESVISGLKEGIKVDKEKLDKFNTLDIDGEVTVTGETGKRVVKESLSMNIDDGEEKVTASMSVTCGEEVKEGQKVEVPTDATDLLTLIQQVATLFQQQ
ncbi:MAG: hypothetical protein Q4G58_08535 [bacterium]|nr:hypothetical protein [bacterium]